MRWRGPLSWKAWIRPKPSPAQFSELRHARDGILRKARVETLTFQVANVSGQVKGGHWEGAMVEDEARIQENSVAHERGV